MKRMNVYLICTTVLAILMLSLIIYQQAKLDQAKDAISDQNRLIVSQTARVSSLTENNEAMRGAIRDMTCYKRGELKYLGEYDLSHYAPGDKSGAAGVALTPYKSVAIPAAIKQQVAYGSTLLIVYPNRAVEIVSVEDFCPTDGRVDMVVPSREEAFRLGVVREISVYQLN